MARPSEEFMLAWASLSGDDPTPGWQAIALPPAGPVEVQAGRRSPDNAESVLLGFSSAQLATAEKLPEGQGFVVERANPEHSGQLRLALTRRFSGSAELFAAMACDVVGALDEAASSGAGESKLLRVFIRRVSAWQEFMRKGSQALSPEAEIGLVGELTVLKAIVDAGVSHAVAVESWVGPLDGVQDFELGIGAIEVKATLSADGFPVKVGSLEQLDDSMRQPLFLAGVRFRQAETGKSLSDMVDELRESTKIDVEAVTILSDRLIAAGYFDIHAERYVRRFIVMDIRVITVDSTFPRLTHATVPSGITHASYRIELEKNAHTNIDMPEALKKLGSL